MTLVGPVASPVTLLPHTPGRDIVIAGNTEETPRTREGRVAAATLEQEMGRRSVVEAIRPIRERAVASSSSAERAFTQKTVAETCNTLVRERHPASPPVWPESSGIPAESQLARTGETAEVGVDAQTPERRVPEVNRAEAGTSCVQHKPSRQTGAATAHAHPRSRD